MNGALPGRLADGSHNLHFGHSAGRQNAAHYFSIDAISVIDLFPLAVLATVVFMVFRQRERARRVLLLGRHLAQFQIEKLMETVADGYLRALGEPDPTRREQIWRYLDANETQLCEQFERFVADFARLGEVETRVSRLPVGIPFATQLFPQATFDLRKALAIHAHGFTQAATNPMQRTPRDKAFTMSAELFLMQHTCHWFCNSRAVADARLLARHKTSHAQVLAAVGADTREAYGALTGLA